LTWNPDKGFHLESFVTRYGPPIPSESFGGFRMIRKSDRRTIKMKPRGYRGWVVAQNVNLFERWDVRFQDRLQIDIDSVLFSNQGEYKHDSYIGTSLYYGIEENVLFPDIVKEEIILGDFRSVQQTRKGISLDEPNYQIVRGLQIREKYLMLHWSLDKARYKRLHSWIWPQAAADALSILTGRSVQLVCREVNRNSRVYVEMRRPKKITNLGILSPLPESYPLDKNRFARMVEFFTKESDSLNAMVCRNIYYQILEARRQKSWQACELLLSTILEAAFRTLQKRPFRPGGKGLDIKQSLREFRKKHLADQWIPCCEKTYEVQDRLRNRNAHPDWLYAEGDPLSDKRKSESLEDMIFLSRFYGYMILALSGEKGLEPNFPKKPFR
jgi:hypothetical protein